MTRRSEVIDSLEKSKEIDQKEINFNTKSEPVKKQETKHHQPKEPDPKTIKKEEEFQDKKTVPAGPYMKPPVELLDTYEKPEYEYNTKQLQERALFLEQRLLNGKHLKKFSIY